VYAIWPTPSTPATWCRRKRTLRNGQTVAVPTDQWLWSPEPSHPAIISRAVFDAAQTVGAQHGTSRDASSHPATRRTYIRCIAAAATANRRAVLDIQVLYNKNPAPGHHPRNHHQLNPESAAHELA
jgi:hypothetical protein